MNFKRYRVPQQCSHVYNFSRIGFNGRNESRPSTQASDSELYHRYNYHHIAALHCKLNTGAYLHDLFSRKESYLSIPSSSHPTKHGIENVNWLGRIGIMFSFLASLAYLSPSQAECATHYISQHQLREAAQTRYPSA
jgi:hypothetical protein